jgi:class 3 adenylate cyclase
MNLALISLFFVLGMTLLGFVNSLISNINSLALYTKERAIEEEKAKSEKLLLNILPSAIADRLKSGETTISDYFEKVAILFADIVGFTNYCCGRDSKEIVELLNEIFYAFDKKTEELGLEKIKTIGDGYMVLGGGLKSNHDDLLKTIDLGDYMIQFMSDYSRRTNSKLSIRVGIHIGSVTAGVIGKTKFAFDIWGDTVNTASRMESSGIPMEIHITEDVANYLTDKKRCHYRGDIEIKGKGKMKTYIIDRYKRDLIHPATAST